MKQSEKRLNQQLEKWHQHGVTNVIEDEGFTQDVMKRVNQRHWIFTLLSSSSVAVCIGLLLILGFDIAVEHAPIVTETGLIPLLGLTGALMAIASNWLETE